MKPIAKSGALFLAGVALGSCTHAGATTAPVEPRIQSSPGQSIDRIWTGVALPPPPELVPLKLAPATTVLLILDMYPENCNAEDRPSCPGIVAPIRKLLETARSKGMRVIYGAGPPANNGPVEPVAALARQAGDGLARGPADKFFGSELDALLKEAKASTVIVTGTSADGAVLNTATGASLRGYSVVVPVDTMASANRFAELYTAWHLKNTSSSISRRITVTRSDLVTIE